MSRQVFALCLISACLAATYAASCSNPKATVTSFSTQDATILTQLGYVGEFELSCGNSVQPNLFAEFPCGKVVPVAKVGENKYQISWVKDTKKPSSGNVVLRLFDEDGYANVRKAQRDGDKASSVKSLIDITVSTKGAYNGPWVKAELLAALFAAGVAYFALTTKSKVQA